MQFSNRTLLIFITISDEFSAMEEKITIKILGWSRL